jgi:hypothetical protein
MPGDVLRAPDRVARPVRQDLVAARLGDRGHAIGAASVSSSTRAMR